MELITLKRIKTWSAATLAPLPKSFVYVISIILIQLAARIDASACTGLYALPLPFNSRNCTPRSQLPKGKDWRCGMGERLLTSLAGLAFITNITRQDQ